MKDGGPAFPGDERVDGDHLVIHPGMTLRDWFAGQALAGLTSRDFLSDGNGELQRRCYAIADNMLAEREKAK